MEQYKLAKGSKDQDLIVVNCYVIQPWSQDKVEGGNNRIKKISMVYQS